MFEGLRPSFQLRGDGVAVVGDGLGGAVGEDDSELAAGEHSRKIKRVKFGFYTDLCYLCNKIADDDDCKAISHRHTNVLTDYS